MQGAARNANTLRKHRNAFAQHRIARTKRSRDAALRFKETTVPQSFLSSPHNTRCNGCDFNWIVTGIENRVSRTLSRKFWQQKYFWENLLFARSPLATANFLGVFAKPIRKLIPVRETFLSRVSRSRARHRAEKWKAN